MQSRYVFFSNIDSPRRASGAYRLNAPLARRGETVQLLLNRSSGHRPFGRLTQIPDDAEPAQELQRRVADVDLIPAKTLTSCGRIMMMVVVPTFAEGQQCDQPVITAIIIGGKVAFAEQVTDRIHHERHMIDQNRAEEEAPGQAGQAADEVAKDAQKNAGDDVELFEPAQFRVLSPILHLIPAAVVEFC